MRYFINALIKKNFLLLILTCIEFIMGKRRQKRRAKKAARRAEHAAKKLAKHNKKAAKKAVRKVKMKKAIKAVGKAAKSAFREVKADVIDPYKNMVNAGAGAVGSLGSAAESSGKAMENLTNPMVAVPIAAAVIGVVYMSTRK